MPWWLFLREGKYKYIRTLVDDEIEELYNLESDPEELINLALNPEYNAILLKYRAKLLAELRATDAAMVERLPPVAESLVERANDVPITNRILMRQPILFKTN